MHKKQRLALLSAAFLSMIPFAHADLKLNVVSDYDLALNAEHWKEPKNDQIPQGLVHEVSLSNPSSPYSLYPKNFLQQPKFVVCYVDCKTPDKFKLSGDSLDKSKMSDWDLVEQSNVYYWLSKYTNYLNQNFNFTPKWFLEVYTNHKVREEGKLLRNNAFYNPAKNTLSFLPASNSFLFKVMGGKINRSGFDPSVVLHETSHFLFQHFFADPINDEISGLNEGFADYMANTFLNNPKVGLIMLQGKTLRDSSTLVDSSGKLKAYVPRLEVHDLGERVALALWKSREIAPDKIAFDRIVMESVQELSQNPFAAIHDFKNIMVKRIRYEFPSQDAAKAQAQWDLIFPGEATKIASLAFLDEPRKNQAYMGFKIRQIVSPEMASMTGSNKDIKANFSLIATKVLTPKQHAILVAVDNDEGTLTTPYWIVVDDERLNVIGAFGIDKHPVTDKEEMKKVKEIAAQVITANDFVKDFVSKVKIFTQFAKGQGELASAYKLKKGVLTETNLDMNGDKVKGLTYSFELKAKLLATVLTLGNLPDIDSVTLYSLPFAEGGPKGLPTLNEQKIIGYKLMMKSGGGQEVILDKFRN